MENYLAREPSPAERLEVAIAHLTAIYVNGHQAKGRPPARISDFLLYRNVWPDTADGRYSDVDRQVLQELL